MVDYDDDALSVDDLMQAFGFEATEEVKPKRSQQKKAKAPKDDHSTSEYPEINSDEYALLSALGITDPQIRSYRPPSRPQPSRKQRERVRDASKHEQQMRTQQWMQDLHRREARIARSRAIMDERTSSQTGSSLSSAPSKKKAEVSKKGEPVIEEGGFSLPKYSNLFSEGGFGKIEPLDVAYFSRGDLAQPKQSEQAAGHDMQERITSQQAQPQTVVEQVIVPIPVKDGFEEPYDEPVDEGSSNEQVSSVPTQQRVVGGIDSQMPEIVNPGNVGFDRRVDVPPVATATNDSLPMSSTDSPISGQVSSEDFVERRTFSFNPVQAGASPITNLASEQSGVIGQTTQPDQVSQQPQIQPVASGPQVEQPSQMQVQPLVASEQAQSFTQQVQQMPSELEPQQPMPSQPAMQQPAHPERPQPVVQNVPSEMQQHGQPPQMVPQPISQQPIQAQSNNQIPSSGPVEGHAIPQGSMPMNAASGQGFISNLASFPQISQPIPSQANPFTPNLNEQSMSMFLAGPIDKEMMGEKEIYDNVAISKRNSILGIILIVVAVLCAVMAIFLLTGLLNVNNTSSGNYSGVAPSSIDSTTSADQDSSSTTTAEYTYVVRGSDGSTHEAHETATFDSNGILDESTIVIDAENAEIAESLMEQLKTEFGDSVKDATLNDNHVIITLNIDRDDLTKETYTELLSANMTEFKEIS